MFGPGWACLVQAFETGAGAVLRELSYDGPDGPRLVYLHEITYEVVAPGVVEVTTDCSAALDGPIGTVTVEHCRILAGVVFPEVGDCSPA